MRNIRLSKSCIGKEEIDAVTDVLHREYLGMGQDVHKFEDDLKDFFGRDVTLVNTGTAALHLAVQGVGIKMEMKYLYSLLHMWLVFKL